MKATPKFSFAQLPLVKVVRNVVANHQKRSQQHAKAIVKKLINRKH